MALTIRWQRVARQEYIGTVRGIADRGPHYRIIRADRRWRLTTIVRRDNISLAAHADRLKDCKLLASAHMAVIYGGVRPWL